MNDRHRCELSFIGRLIYLLILGGVQARNQKDLSDVALLVSEEPLIGGNVESLKRRVIRMEKNTIKPLTNIAHGENILLTCYHFINTLVDDGAIILPEKSHLAILVDHLLSLIDLNDETTQKRLANSKKQARKWLEALRKEGYYQ